MGRRSRILGRESFWRSIMSNIKQIPPITRIQAVIKDRSKTSQKKKTDNKEKDKNPEDQDNKDQPSDNFHVDEYV